MPPKPTLLAPSTAKVLEAIGENLGHDSPDETVQAMIEHLGQQAATDDPEQLAENLAAAGGHGAGGGRGRSPLDEKAEETLTLSDLRTMEREQLSPAQHLKQNYGIDPAEFTSQQALHRRVSQRRDELKSDR